MCMGNALKPVISSSDAGQQILDFGKDVYHYQKKKDLLGQFLIWRIPSLD